MAGLAGPVLAPLAAADFGVEAIYVGVYVAAIYAIAACSSLISGGIIARFGPLRVSQVCLAIAATALACAATGHPLALLANAVLMGMAYGPPTPASSTMLAQGAPPRWMNLLFSIRQTGVPIGNMLAGAILPSLALAIGWQQAALATAAACVVLVLLVQPARERVDVARDRTRRIFAGGLFAGPLRLVFLDAALRRMALVSFAYSGMQSALSAFLVIYLHHDVGIPLVLAGIVLSAAQIAGASGRIIWGIVADRLAKPRHVLGGLGVIMTAAALTTGLFTPAWPLPAIFAVCIVFGGTAVAWNGVYLAQIARLAPPGRAGEATGGTSFVTFSGVVAAPVLFSAIVSSTGSYALAFATIAAMTGAAGLSFFIFPDRRAGA
ncbi:MAG TPA: MFS transporter [Alphaproteobacteria bacterium]|nr:MFS transporter [Alphaproteobacteria bacterium]